jgi:predicted phosphodiesterase
MTKIALITDTHFGCRNDSPTFADHISRFYRDVFFPYLKENGINFIIHLGDIVDRRKYINFVTAKRLYDDFINPIQSQNLFLHAIIGNHDTYYKNTNAVNSMGVLYGDNARFNYYADPTHITIDNCKILLMPWICSDNYERAIEEINNTDAQILFGHLELNGFEMYKGYPNDHGYDPNIFQKFDVVCSGHFHHKSSRGNIHYRGAPYEMTWSDYDDPRGFHVFDTQTRELQFIENPNKIFHKLFYNDGVNAESINPSMDYAYLKGCIVKVIIKNKENPYMFDRCIEKIEAAQPMDVQIVEDHLNLNLELDDDILDEAEDTLSILNKFITQVAAKENHKDLYKIMSELYNEALMVE